MKESLIFEPKELSRQDRLHGWMAERGVTKSKLAQALGISNTMVGLILSGQKRPPQRIQQLIDLGIPREFLPQPDKAEY